MKRYLGHALVVLILPAAFPAMAQVATGDTAAPFAGGAVATTELSAITGRDDTAMEIRAQNTSTVSHNSVINADSGNISFDAGSFAAMNGLSLLSANTGNNVSINSSLNVNVSIQPN